jgi:hypothetical protein
MAAIVVAPILAGVAVVVMLRTRVVAAAAAVVALACLPLLTAPPARAHDPGQGTEIGTAELMISGDGAGTVSVFMRDLRDVRADTLTPDRLVARRAGQTVTASLGQAPSSRNRPAYAGLITLPAPGLWFIYAELRDGPRQVELWRAVEHDTPGPTVQRRPIYLPAGTGPRPAGEYAAGALLLAAGALLVAWAALVSCALN